MYVNNFIFLGGRLFSLMANSFGMSNPQEMRKIMAEGDSVRGLSAKPMIRPVIKENLQRREFFSSFFRSEI